MKREILKSVGNAREDSRRVRIKDRFDVESIWEDTEMSASRKRTAKEESYPLASLTSQTY